MILPCFESLKLPSKLEDRKAMFALDANTELQATLLDFTLNSLLLPYKLEVFITAHFEAISVYLCVILLLFSYDSLRESLKATESPPVAAAPPGLSINQFLKITDGCTLNAAQLEKVSSSTKLKINAKI